MTHTRLTLAILLSLFLCAAARAELKWEQTVVELYPAAGEKQAIGHFKYQNVGKMPVRIRSVRTTCGCTTAQTQKEQVLPGEKGEITAIFTIGDRKGLQAKNISVKTDDPAHLVTVLSLRATIAEPLEIKPSVVYWSLGEEARPKTIVVKAGKNFQSKDLKVTSSSGDFLTNVEPAGRGQWKIEIKPKQTTRAISGKLTIQPDNAQGGQKLFYAHVQVLGGRAQAR